MTLPSETAPVRRTTEDGNRHLIHCPSSWDHYLLDAPALGAERFVLTGDLPVRHPLFNDGPGRFHDPQVTMEAVAEVGALTGHRYFGVPEDRTGLFHRFGVELTEAAAWRVDPVRERSRMAVDLTAVPANVMNGVPRGLDLSWEVRIDDVRCATGSAGMVFLMPNLYRRHLAYNSRVLRGTLELADEPATRPVPVSPAEVGRERQENVVVSRPETDGRGRLRVWLMAEGVSPAITGLHDELTGTHLLESLRQTALLAAGRDGLDPAACVVERTEVHFRAQAGLDLPMRCVAVAGERTRDAQGRPAVPVTLTVTQSRRPVAEASLTVVRDF